ncbi:MAG: D-alanyl-D-alanine carboxypeptidase/D-alanyl-D-alanine-endopeptidase, partial [Draconibacterium sp.]
FFVFLVIACCGYWAFTQPVTPIQKSIQNFVADVDFEHASVGIHVVRLSDGKVLGTYEAKKSLATASTLKVVTTATALLQNGADFRYKTPIGYTGKLQGGILKGDLVIKGVGDPTFNSKYFPENDALQKVVDLLKRKKITQIKGNIVLDDSNFKSEVPRTWVWEDIGNYYGAALHSINYRDNTYKINFQTGKAGTEARILSVIPKQNLTFENKVLASTVNADNAYIFGSPFSCERVVKGTLPQFRKSFIVKGAMPNPEITFGEAVKNALQKQGVMVTGKVQINSVSIQEVLGYIQSPRLKEIITKTNQHSVNLFAEAMLRLVKNSKSNQQEDLLEALVEFWKNKGLHTDGLYLHDGSGLSHFNAVNPAFFTEMLRCMTQTKVAGDFKESLAVSGKSGTLKYLGKNTNLVGKVQGKSGSMQQVCSYAGYMTTQKGEKVAFAILLNNFS